MDTRSPYRLHSRLGYRVSRLSRVIQVRIEAVLAPHGLTRLMWCVLTGVGEEGLHAPSELADYVGVTRPTMSRLLRTLEQRGYVQRRPVVSGDARGVEIGLSEAGRQLVVDLRAPIDGVTRHFTDKLTAEQQAALMQAIDALMEGESRALADF
ncbi:MarR family winged helix-turn-helix transcriptional regulator [Pannonibacter tanglangensis]|uniref:MarR family transcriptional regulator n=1 Tax=Pannonibacter tanglangensis TaxID=2750084 RepID=A0ABW9ZGE2_9HYPH|nr:MarR family transcriptional regulator [Pannonibacter sp. XCT-34]NBN63925.1 MarR family transcriptional regulator [Pannonibacter sp. XCT-34]